MVRGTPAPSTGLSLQVPSMDDSTELSPDYVEALSPASVVGQEQAAGEPSYLPRMALRSPEFHNAAPPHDSDNNMALAMPPPQDGGMAIVRTIASYLSFSDAESLASLGDLRRSSEQQQQQQQMATSWSLGEMRGMGQPLISWSSMLTTPPTPGLMMLSPAGDLPEEERHVSKKRSCPDLVDLEHEDDDDDDEEDDEDILRRLRLQQKRWIQQKLTAFVFAHPGSIRSYCLEAHQAARDIHKQRKENQDRQEAARQYVVADPETLREPAEEFGASAAVQDDSLVKRRRRRKRKEKEQRLRILKTLIDALLHNVPLSVMIDVIEAVMDTGLDTSYAFFRIQCNSVNSVVSALSFVIHKVWDGILHFNPFAIIEATISMQFTAVGKTSEVLVSGIQSVATGMGSASNAALQRLSRSGTSHHMASSASSSALMSSHGKDSGVFSKMGLRRNRSSEIAMNKKLLRKLSTVNSAAEVISYREREEEGIISKHAKKRVQRMMHYDVSLRPFVATVVVPPNKCVPARRPREDSFGNVDFPTRTDQPALENNSAEGVPSPPPASASTSPLESHFMCTPSSFPPSPAKRRMILEMGTKFVEDVVFLARDQLRVEDALGSENERTRAMAHALRDERRLAVFTREEGSGINLSCGQHVATKVGNVLYCSTRSMVPVLRNCFVYFEMSVMSPPVGNVILQASMATLSIGLSTLEMPLNTLVGAWKGSVGLCTTGQILTAGQWCSPLDPSRSAYGDNATVGCLVYLDDESAFETWDGVMISAAITFNVNGTVVSPPLFSTPMGGPTGACGGVAPGVDVSAAARALPQQMPGPVSTLPLLVPMEEELFPTLTLHSPTTQVMCRFSAEDILAASPEHIGAPPGVTVYAVDGSVLFDDDDDNSTASNQSDLSSSRESYDE